MVEKKNSFIFDETLILNQLFEDLARRGVKNIPSQSVQPNRQMQENIYQSARGKKNSHFPENKESINSGLNKKNEIIFWNKAYDSGSVGESRLGVVISKKDAPQNSSSCKFGYDSSSSGE